MHIRILQKRSVGIGIMLVFSILGVLISIYNFFLTYGPISYTGGAELVIFSSLSITVLSFLTYFFLDADSRWERACLYTLIFCLLLGTLFAAWLLESDILFFAMITVLLGWLIQIFTKQENQ